MNNTVVLKKCQKNFNVSLSFPTLYALGTLDPHYISNSVTVYNNWNYLSPCDAYFVRVVSVYTFNMIKSLTIMSSEKQRWSRNVTGNFISAPLPFYFLAFGI